MFALVVGAWLLVGCLVGCWLVVGWLVGWLAGWLVGWLVGCFLLTLCSYLRIPTALDWRSWQSQIIDWSLCLL